MSATAPMQRTEVVRLNNEIAKCSGRRDLAGAETLFAQLTASRAANSHSYSSMINAHVMCGDIIGAQRVFDQLRNEKRLRLDIVSCTSMLKGFSKIGDVSSSLTLLASMRTVQPKLVPNVRTLNTFLRACIVAGEPEEASTIFAQMTRDSKVAPDVSSWEYLVVLLSQQLAVSKILPILGRLKDDATMVSGLGLMAISLARACAILGDWKGCSKALGQARVFLDRNDAAESTAAAADSEAEEAEGRVVAGGKRAWRQGADTDSREQSLAVYRTHRTAELRQQVNVIADYALRASASGVDGATDSLFGRVFSFGTTTTSSSTDEVVSAVMRCRKVKFGLEAFSKRHDKCGDSKAGKSEPKNAIGKRKRDAVTPDEATEGRFALMESQLRSCFDSKSFLDLPRIFGTPSRPVKLEMGAGAGEWVVAQARSDPSACWVSLELRHDRVYETFTRAVFSGVSNLAVLGGNALELLPLRFAPCSLSHVFVNFPEPPQQTGHDFTTQSSHLLCNVLQFPSTDRNCVFLNVFCSIGFLRTDCACIDSWW